MYRNAEIDVNSAATILALCLLASVTPSAVLLGPLIVGGLITELGFTPQAAGNMIFAELSGAALGASVFTELPVTLTTSSVCTRLSSSAWADGRQLSTAAAAINRRADRRADRRAGRTSGMEGVWRMKSRRCWGARMSGR